MCLCSSNLSCWLLLSYLYSLFQTTTLKPCFLKVWDFHCGFEDSNLQRCYVMSVAKLLLTFQWLVMLSLSGSPWLLEHVVEDTAVLWSMGDCFLTNMALCPRRLESLCCFWNIENCLSSGVLRWHWSWKVLWSLQALANTHLKACMHLLNMAVAWKHICVKRMDTSDCCGAGYRKTTVSTKAVIVLSCYGHY